MSASTTTATHPTDHDILDLVRSEFDWLPQLDASHVGITIDGAVITLSGEVPALAQVRVATEAALRVKGVSSVANDVTVRLPWKDVQPDREIATAVFDAIFWNTTIPRERVKIDVTDRVVTLSGELDWNYQRQAAERIAHTIVGVHQVHNDITLPARASAEDAAARIRSALLRSATLDAQAISVEVEGNVVTLSGNVQSISEKCDAARGAWSSPYVTDVRNLLTIKAIR